jgi:hypothetical protein
MGDDQAVAGKGRLDEALRVEGEAANPKFDSSMAVFRGLTVGVIVESRG